MNTLANKILSKLISEAECITGSDLETIVFKSKSGSYEVNFYLNDEGESIVEDFGFTSKKVWNQLEPTKEHEKQIKKILNNKYVELYENQQREESIEAPDDREHGIYSYGY